MKFRFALLLALLLPAFASATAGETLKADKESSKIKFVGTKTDGKHEGGFKEFTSVIDADFANPANGSLKIEIDAASLFSDDEKLTNHLKNPDFFDVRKYPKIKFESTKIVHGDEGTIKIVGKMTMLDETIEVEIPVEAKLDDSALVLKAKFKIDRTKWGMTYGVGKIDNDVEINADLTFKRS